MQIKLGIDHAQFVQFQSEVQMQLDLGVEFEQG